MPFQHRDQPVRRLLDEVLQLLVGRWLDGHEGRLAGVRVPDIHPVQHENMEMGIEV